MHELPFALHYNARCNRIIDDPILADNVPIVLAMGLNLLETRTRTHSHELHNWNESFKTNIACCRSGYE